MKCPVRIKRIQLSSVPIVQILRINHGKKFASGKVYINGLEYFWSYAKQRPIKFHGVSQEKFPLYLKEMEFRYNYHTYDLFDLLSEKLTNLVPNLL